jgi:Alpha-L-fucosidase
MESQPFRQIHLDFHTSPLIKDVAADFDPVEFATTLRKARVNSINIFAKCHHGFSYYPTKVGVPHPHLKRADLMGEMIEALHAQGIRCPIYYTIVWDEQAAQHADWLQVDIDGKLIGREPLGSDFTSWRFLCMNSPYMDYVEAQVSEIIDHYDVDGFWFDIFFQNPQGCVCHHCQAGMEKLGFNPALEKDRLDHNRLVEQKAMERLEKLVHSKAKNATILFNGRMRLDNNPGINLRSELKYFTHLEIESLPSGEWGYLHFPMYARYCQPLGKEIVGMNGRFHTSWGDFGGLKNQAAFEFECYRMLATGAKCSVGDQLHPNGRLDPVTYDFIGKVFADIARKEEWCKETQLSADIGLLMNTRSQGGLLGKHPGSVSDEGATQMLLELQQQFHLLDSASEFKDYPVLIVPDEIGFDSGLAQKVEEYVKQGGALILTGESGLTPGKERFALPDFPAVYGGPAPYQIDYLRLDGRIASGLHTEYPYVLYSQGTAITAKPGAEILATAVHPYFNRSWNSFCSHRQTPPDLKDTNDPLITKQGRIIYIANPLFKAYRETGYKAYKSVFKNCLDLLLTKPILVTNLPSTAEASVLTQGNRQIVHILHYIPQRRAEIDIIEDIIPLYDVEVKVRWLNNEQASPARVYLAPAKEELPFTYHEGCVSFRVPKVTGHAMAVIE